MDVRDSFVIGACVCVRIAARFALSDGAKTPRPLIACEGLDGALYRRVRTKNGTVRPVRFALRIREPAELDRGRNAGR